MLHATFSQWKSHIYANIYITKIKKIPESLKTTTGNYSQFNLMNTRLSICAETKQLERK